MRCRLAAAVLSASALLAPATAWGQDATLVDRIVAVVDDEPIFYSDLEQVIVLGLVERRPDEDDQALRRRALDGTVAQRLRLREVDRYGIAPLPTAAVDDQLAAIRGRFADRPAFERALAALGLDPERLRLLLARQLQVLRYVEERLGPRVFVELDDIQRYYDGPFSERLRAGGEEPPPIDQVREAIRALLREVRLNQEIDTWTESLRQEADIVDLLDRAEEPLPPVVERIEGDAQGSGAGS